MAKILSCRTQQRGAFNEGMRRSAGSPTGVIRYALDLLQRVEAHMTSIPTFFCSLSFAATVLGAGSAVAASFGTGDNVFGIPFVLIGDPGNPGDENRFGWGSVGRIFNISMYEVSRGMIENANAEGGLEIRLRDMRGFGGNGANQPAIGPSWNEAARLVNWLNVSKGFPPAYKFVTQPGDVDYNRDENILLWDSGDPGFNPANPFRNKLAQYFLPSVDEWHKVAYYDPQTGAYFNYPTGSDVVPIPVAIGQDEGTAVWNQDLRTGPAPIRQAGGLSPYGAMALGGNVEEWQESAQGDNEDPARDRWIRGGSWSFTDDYFMASTNGEYSGPRSSGEPGWVGFRVASIP